MKRLFIYAYLLTILVGAIGCTTREALIGVGAGAAGVAAGAMIEHHEDQEHHRHR